MMRTLSPFLNIIELVMGIAYTDMLGVALRECHVALV